MSGVPAVEVLRVLDFLYTGQIPLQRSTVSSIRNLAVQLSINLLVELCDAFKAKQNSSKVEQSSVGLEDNALEGSWPGLPVEDITVGDCQETNVVVGSMQNSCIPTLPVDNAEKLHEGNSHIEEHITQLAAIHTDISNTKSSQIITLSTGDKQATAQQRISLVSPATSSPQVLSVQEASSSVPVVVMDTNPSMVLPADPSDLQEFVSYIVEPEETYPDLTQVAVPHPADMAAGMSVSTGPTDTDPTIVTFTGGGVTIGSVDTYTITLPGGETLLMEVQADNEEKDEVQETVGEELDMEEVEEDNDDAEEELGFEAPYRLTCEWCSKVFDNLDALRAHVKRCHQELMHQCQHCLRKFATRRTFEKHMDICTIGKKFNGRFHCPECSYNATKLNPVVNHYRTFHKQKPTKKCETCGANFVSRAKYYEHMLKAHDVDVSSFRPVLTCEECSFKTMRPGLLRRHQEVHTRQPTSCPVCSKVFISTRTLKKHVSKQHGSDVCFSCHLCQFSSKYKGTLESHQYRQHGLLPSLHHKVHSCNDCSQTFLTMGELTKHIAQRHAKEKRFLCAHCSKGFRNKIHLTIHERSHTGERPFICKHCSYTSRSRQTLATHMRTVHSELKPYVCELCGHSTKFYGNLKKHKVICTRKAHLAT